jgi:ABC-type Mn2+/Zn2+ transport system permease subunit
MKSLSAGASLFGGASVFAGFYVSYTRDLPLGPVIIVTASVFLFLSSILRFLLRRREADTAHEAAPAAA